MIPEEIVYRMEKACNKRGYSFVSIIVVAKLLTIPHVVDILREGKDFDCFLARRSSRRRDAKRTITEVVAHYLFR